MSSSRRQRDHLDEGRRDSTSTDRRSGSSHYRSYREHDRRRRDRRDEEAPRHRRYYDPPPPSELEPSKYDPFEASDGSDNDDPKRSRTSTQGPALTPNVDPNNFDVKPFKSYFDRMFFRPTDLIRHGSPSYDDFWKFHDKIQALRRRTTGKDKSKSRQEGEDTDGGAFRVLQGCVTIPAKYSKPDSVPFTLKETSMDEYILRLNPDDQDYVRRRVPSGVIQAFIETVTYFLDFSQKERFSKLKKLRQAQNSLPIAAFREQIIDSLSRSNVLIIAGDTGCGKSTQVPQFLVKAGYTHVACTQPRRIACLSLCKRVAYETLNEYGSEIGYQIRFERHKTAATKVVFITEGLLLRQVSTDCLLSAYNVIVLDEVHERHLHGDFLLGIVKCLLYQRLDIKIVLMSATINTELFKEYFQGLAPILQVPGRLYPIRVQYRPVSVEELSSRSSRINPGPYVRILQLIDDKFPQDERGDVLIFLSGMNEITTIQEATALYAEQTRRWIILALHSSLSIDDQDKVFDYPPEGVRKCILSTNIAETSITIDGIRFVVDSGKVKEMAYDPNCKMQRLKEFWISKASAEQRKGRAGRTGPGVCYRLYAEEEYAELQPYSTPEIQRVPLDSLLLQMISIGISDVRKFPFIEPPTPESIESSMARLTEQNVITADEKLTPIGETLAQLPVDVTIGKMLIMGTVFDQIDAVLSLAAALSVQSPFTNWAHRNPDCVAARKSLDSDHGDPFTLLNAYRAWLEEKARAARDGPGGSTAGATRKWCKRRGFEEQRFYEMTKLRQQFKSLLQDAKLIPDAFEGRGGASEALSSAERSARYGELKQLRTLRREHRLAAPRKKKILKLGDFDAADADFSDDGAAEGGEGTVDIRDVEFRLRHDSRQVRDLLDGSTAYGAEDLTMLKIILCSGLYPQLAVADDFNKYKPDSEQIFHTKGKGFTVLHPMGVFANCPDVLQLADSDIITLPGFSNSKHALSARHQLLCFLTLLETNKPYLVNAFRLPAAQAVFLFGREIDCDPEFKRFIIDNWLEVQFPDAVSARAVVATAVELRDTWGELLETRLAARAGDGEGMAAAGPAPVDAKRGRALSRSLVGFLRAETFYTVRRLLAADVKDIYSREPACLDPTRLEAEELERGFEIAPHGVKGGVAVTSYLTYGCLYRQGEESELGSGGTGAEEPWECPGCEKELIGSPLELLVHQVKCRRKATQESLTAEGSDELKARPFAKLYHCPECNQELHLTPVEILRHKKEHATKASSSKD